MRTRFLTFLLLFVFAAGCKNVPEISTKAPTQKASKTYFHDAQQTLISAHRGGSGLKGYPENALETLQYLYMNGITVFEIDVFQSSDKEIMLLHDNHLERTTSGNGSLNGKSSEDLRKLKLVDDFGNTTEFRIPYLRDILDWAKKSGAYLMIDFKDSAKYEDVIELIRSKNMQEQCVLISYSVGQAVKQNKLAPEMLISVSARNEEELNRILDTDIHVNQMIAFTGTRLSPPELYQRLNEMKIPAILGTLGNLDKSAAARGDKMYTQWADMGINIIATDRPLNAFNAVKK